MIKKNQQLLNHLHVITDGLILYLSLPAAFYIRFYILSGGHISVPLEQYLILGIVLTAVQLFSHAAFGLYRTNRRIPIRRELARLCFSSLLVIACLFSFLFIQHYVNYSRLTLGIWSLMSVCMESGKRVVMRCVLRFFRRRGFNQKHVIILGDGEMALSYLDIVRQRRDLGYHPDGFLSAHPAQDMAGCKWLGTFERLPWALSTYRPDEVICAIGPEDYARVPEIISVCEKDGTKLSIIPFYAKYMPSNPQFDEFEGIPLLNIRHIPLDNLANAFCKRTMDILGSLILILLLSPVMLLCALGVKLSSPGPVLFKQKRVGRNKVPFYMYKFRSMQVNDEQETAWSTPCDSRRTRFGSFIRKVSLDELPQLFNVLKGEMSLVGPRPEIPYHVEHFKEDIPLYMVKHQVRPGITGWAQVNDLRGDTSIKDRIEHDIYYIEHWSLLFDIKILLLTVFGGKFVNSEAQN